MDLTYLLPKEYIAQTPVEPRDHSKLLVFHRQGGSLIHTLFKNLPDFLNSMDVVVLNNTRVLPVRLTGQRQSGGKVRLLLIPHPPSPDVRESVQLQALVQSRKPLPIGEILSFRNSPFTATVLDHPPHSPYTLLFNDSIGKILSTLGQAPLPPYIKRPNDKEDERQKDLVHYQSIFAEKPGSIAAPTASLHFTPTLLKNLQAKNIVVHYITLHVGLGTFLPLKSHLPPDFPPEYYHIPRGTAQAVQKAHEEKRRILAVGTTVCKALETSVRSGFHNGDGQTNLFITPGFEFQQVTALLTNFHLPQSSPLHLTAAFAGPSRLLQVYEEAKQKQYRFLSYGDAMLIL